MAQLRLGYGEITTRRAEVLQITHNTAEEARRYRRHYPMAFPYLADADRAVHERYGVPLQEDLGANLRTVAESTVAAAADFLLRGERTANPIPAARRWGGRSAEQAVFVVDRGGVIRAVYTAGTNAAIPTVATLVRDLDALR